MVKSTSRQMGDRCVVEIEDDLTLTSDMSGLKSQVSAFLDTGVRTIAMRFTKDSYLSTRSIAVLITCLEDIRERGGRLIIVEPNDDIVSVLNLIDMDKIISYGPSVEEACP